MAPIRQRYYKIYKAKRQWLKEQMGYKKKPPKTGAERQREYRNRKKAAKFSETNKLSEENVSEDGQCEAMLNVKHEDSESTGDSCTNSDLPGAGTVSTETATSIPQSQITKVKEECIWIKPEPCDPTENESPDEDFDLKSDNFEDKTAEYSQNFVQPENASDNPILREQLHMVEVKTEDISVNADFVSECSADLILKSEEVDLGCDYIEDMPDSRLHTAGDSNGPIYENEVECTDPCHGHAVDAGIPNGIASDISSGQTQTIKVKTEESNIDIDTLIAVSDRPDTLLFNLADFNLKCNCADLNSGTNKKSDDSTADSNLSEKHLSQCDVDGRTSDNATSTKSHIDDKSHTCNVCKHKFIPKSFLQQHILAHINEIPDKYEMYQKQFGANRCLYHTFFTPTDNRYKCKLCKKDFSHSSQLTVHMAEHPLKIKCNICGRAYAKLSNLRKHVVGHNGEKPFECEFCGWKYSALSSLNKHRLVHAPEKRFQCTVCGKKLSTNFCLKQHMSRHDGSVDTGEQP